MLIGELSRRTNVHAHLLRYYESQGLLDPTRGSSGYREYTDDAVLTVNQIRKLLEAGLSTQEIAFTLPCATGTGPDLEPCPELLDVLRTRLHDLDARIDTLLHSRQSLWYYIDATEQRMSHQEGRAPATQACAPAGVTSGAGNGRPDAAGRTASG